MIDGCNLGGATRHKFSVFARGPLFEASFDGGSVAFDVPVLKHPGIRIRQAKTLAAWAHLVRESQGKALAPTYLKQKRCGLPFDQSGSDLPGSLGE